MFFLVKDFFAVISNKKITLKILRLYLKFDECYNFLVCFNLSNQK